MFSHDGFDLAAWREQPYLIIRVDDLWLPKYVRVGGWYALIIDGCDFISCSFSEQCSKRWVYFPRAVCMSIVELNEGAILGANAVICFGNIDFDGAEHVENGVVRPGLPELVQTGDAQ